jgi:hypothetical protein
MEKIDTVIHVNQDLSSESRKGFEKRVNAMPGIIDMKFCSKRHHLINLAYDGDVTNGLSILSQVRKTGLSAQLVGF